MYPVSGEYMTPLERTLVYRRVTPYIAMLVPIYDHLQLGQLKQSG